MACSLTLVQGTWETWGPSGSSEDLTLKVQVLVGSGEDVTEESFKGKEKLGERIKVERGTEAVGSVQREQEHDARGQAWAQGDSHMPGDQMREGNKEA